MGAFLDKPKTEKFTTSGEGNDIRYGVSAMQGWRMEMEDAHVCNTKLGFGENYSFFGVFDGHAGPKVAQYCSKNLLNSITESYKAHQGIANEVERIKKAIHEGFLNLDKKLREDQSEDRSGTTAIVSVITPDKIIFGNCGDSRGLLCRDGKVFFATIDHKPMNEEERMRIEKAGGTVMMQRVNGSLAVSRALGDFDYKRSLDLEPIEQLVSPEPEVYVLERDSATDQYLLLACDGIYDVMTNDAVVEFVSRQLFLTNDLTKVCSTLIDTCLNKNSRDNMSVVLVTFPSAPKVSEDAIKQEEALQKEAQEAIEKQIRELVEVAVDPLDVEENHVLDLLDKQLPKRYEIYSKRAIISQYLAERRKEKFGNEDDEERGFTGYTDAADAPSEFIEAGFGDNLVPDLRSPELPLLPSEHTSEQQVQSPLSDPDTLAKEGKNPPPKTIM